MCFYSQNLIFIGLRIVSIKHVLLFHRSIIYKTLSNIRLISNMLDVKHERIIGNSKDFFPFTYKIFCILKRETFRCEKNLGCLRRYFHVIIQGK